MAMHQHFGFAVGALFAASVAFGAVSSARAADGIVDEVKGGVLAHDVPIGGHNKEDGADINAEVLFGSPSFLKWAFAPRPHLGVNINTSGDTSAAYFGLTWQLFNISNIYTNLGLGGAVHDGKLETNDTSRKELGSRVLFHESLEVGYQFVARQSVSLYIDHISDAGLTKHNDGLTNLGVRYGYGF